MKSNKLRVASALARQESRKDMTPHKQLALLDQRLGVGVGAVKERARLHKLLEDKKAS